MTRIKDVISAGQNVSSGIRNRIDAESDRRGKEMADAVFRNTENGRGLWSLILWPAWFLIFLTTSTIFTAFLQKFGLKMPMALIGIVLGFLYARGWYRMPFTMSHPFLGSVLGYVATLFGLMTLAYFFKVDFATLLGR